MVFGLIGIMIDRLTSNRQGTASWPAVRGGPCQCVRRQSDGFLTRPSGGVRQHIFLLLCLVGFRWRREPRGSLPVLRGDLNRPRWGSGVEGQGVVLNLVFDTADARRLGIEGHVCELQLTTRGFAKNAQVRSFLG